MKSDGFNLLELMIATGLAAACIFWTKDQIMESLNLRSLVSERNHLQMLEQDLRHSFLNDGSFLLNMQNSPSIKTCMESDQIPCPNEKSIELISILNKPVTGGFASSNKSCSGRACPIQIVAKLRGTCASGNSCDVVSSLIVDYTITVDRGIYRKSFMQRMKPIDNPSDENQDCPDDDQDRTSFANSISPDKLACIYPIGPKQTLLGVKPSRCQLGLEILSGFTISGDPICQSINWGTP